MIRVTCAEVHSLITGFVDRANASVESWPSVGKLLGRGMKGREDLWCDKIARSGWLVFGEQLSCVGEDQVALEPARPARVQCRFDKY